MTAPIVVAALLLCLSCEAQVQDLVLSSCNDPADWTAGALDPVHKYEGTGALLWDHGKADSISLKRVPMDWSRYNTLSLWMCSPKATNAAFVLVIDSEPDPAKPGGNYYSVPIHVDFTGWRHLRYSLEDDLQPVREPVGWQHITRLTFTASGWGNTPDPGTTVTIADIRLSKQLPPSGPLMSDREFIDALDLSLPALAEVKAAAAKGDLSAAKHAYAAHLRARTTPKWFFDWRAKPDAGGRPPNPDLALADRALSHEYTVTGVPLRFLGKIVWKANHTKPFDPEWTWQFSRHDWWPALGRAYWDTGDEKYAREWLEELRGWIADNPMPAGVANGIGSRWRTIECGIRLSGSWPDSFFHFLSSPEFTDDDVVMMAKSFAEQAGYLYRNPTKGNWLTMESNGMGHVGILFSEFKEAKLWRDTAIARLYNELDNQVYPDGVQIELSPGYHFVALRNFLGLAQIAQLNEVKLPEAYVAKLERMYACGLWAMRPDRNIPPVNDSWDINVPAQLAEGFRLFPKRTDFQWIATDGKQGTMPDHLSHWFPWAGWAVMRSGWGRDDAYLFFDVGPFGYGHQHEDKLAFNLSAYGANLVIDTGSYRYDTSPMRAYVIGPWAHSIVFVDGKTQRRSRLRDTYVNEAPQTNLWFTAPTFDYGEGVYDDGFGPTNALKVTHQRQILFVKPDYWVVIDTLTPPDADEHQYLSLFHLGTPDAEVGEKGVVTTLNPGKANLQIMPLPWTDVPVTTDIVKGQEHPYLLGWAGTHGIGNAHPIPVARFQWAKQGVTRLAYVFCPIKPGGQPPIAAIEPTKAEAGKAECARLAFADGRSDSIALNLSPGQPYRIGGIASNGLLTVIRKDAAGKTVGVIQVGPQGQP